MNSQVILGLIYGLPILWGQTEKVNSLPFDEYRKAAEYPLLIISFDGFRWNYLQRTKTPHFDEFIKKGVHAKYGLKNAFITKTFPNHFTLVTGLWEESHGIVANDMYDPVLNQTFAPQNKTSQSDPAWFDVGAEPIWVTNQIQKEDGRSGSIMWVGGEAPIKLVTASRHIPFSPDMKNETKIDTMISWFTDKRYPINLGLLYFDEPDGFAHYFGPESEQVTRMIGGLDRVIGYLLKRLEDVGLLHKMNIIVTSDHGFAATPKDKSINLDDFIDPTTYTLLTPTPIATIWPNEGQLQEIFKNLTEGARKNGNFDVYLREEVPEKFHYSLNRRISPIVAVAKDKYSFVTASHPYFNKGNHGFDNNLQDMHPFFLAMGPSFKKGHVVDTFNSVDIYPLMCHLLDLRPAANNGSLDIVMQLLQQPTERRVSTTMMTFITYFVAVIVITSIAGIYMVAACRYHRYLKRMTPRSVKPSVAVFPVVQSSAPFNTTAIPVGTVASSYHDPSMQPLLAHEEDDS